MFKQYYFSAFVLLTSLTLTGCGGGSNSSSTTTPPATGITAPGWTMGYFAPEQQLKNYCATPRTGIDPYTNSLYPDQQGTAMHEKLWLRSWSNNTYLWYNEITDRDPYGYSVTGYFNMLKTDALTDSGSPKDNFHYTLDTAEFNSLVQSGVTSGYGIEWVFGNTTPPRSLIVAYTEPGSPAELAGVSRGAMLIEVDGVDFVNTTTATGINIINAALFPEYSGSIHDFKFQTPQGTVTEVRLTSADVASTPVQNVKILNNNSRKTGYFQFNSHIALAQEQLVNAITTFQNENISELVVDLRYNGGGLLALASQLGYMVAGDNNIQERFFEQTIFNDKIQPVQPTPFYNRVIDYQNSILTSQPLPTLGLSRVFVLTTEATCSASEAFINGLRGVDLDVIQIGETTCGKPYGYYPQDNCGTTYFTIQMKGVNAKQFGDYADGFTPVPAPVYQADVKGCEVQDDLNHYLGDTDEGMLSTALYYMDNYSCPVRPLMLTSSRSLFSGTSDNNAAIKVKDHRYRAILLDQKLYPRIQLQVQGE